jgi:hypothetical protein
MKLDGVPLPSIWQALERETQPPGRLRSRLAFVASLLREEAEATKGRPRLLWRDGTGAVCSHSLGEKGLVIGRSLEADIVVPVADVSRRHCRVGRDARGAWIEDLGSRHGTRHNGVAVEGRLPLVDGDTIELPAFRLAFICGGGA